MAHTLVLTPSKHREGAFSTRVAGGIMPLTPSTPKTPKAQPAPEYESIHHGHGHGHGNLNARFARAISKTSVRDSPKSNIAARPAPSPRRLDQVFSDFTLTGSGPTQAHRHTPKRNRNKILYTASDRFIPNRTASAGLTIPGMATKIHTDRTPPRRPKSSSSDMMSLEGFSSLTIHESPEPRPKLSPGTVIYQQQIAAACGLDLDQRILAYKPNPPESQRPIDLRSEYNRPLKPKNNGVNSNFKRKVPTAPDRVLDAPCLADDYYLNLLDWSIGNHVAIGLERNVYIWSADSGSVTSLLECPEDTYIASVKWSADGAYVAAGLGSGEVQIWDIEDGSKLRSMTAHDTRVSVMGWSKHLLSTGARDGLVFNNDVRIAQHKVAELHSHTSEVCGLEWRADGAQLASGGNDNLVTIWDARALNAPKFQKYTHKAAVKALAWCPWQNNLLATGGGSHDRHIHFWNTTSGARTNSIDTGSQVTSLRWSLGYREIVSTSGFPDNSLSIWSYPTLVKNIEIPAHESRILNAALSPDGQTLATAAADESLKFWKIFERKPGSGQIPHGFPAAKGLLSKDGLIR